jgi:hypothetical protein
VLVRVERLRTRHGVAGWVPYGAVWELVHDTAWTVRLDGPRPLHLDDEDEDEEEEGGEDEDARDGGVSLEVVTATWVPPVLTLWGVAAAWRVRPAAADADDAVLDGWAHWAAARPWGPAEAVAAIAALDLSARGVTVAVPAALVASLPHAGVAQATYPHATPHGALVAAAPTWAELYRAARLLAPVLRRYPPPLWAALHLRELVLVGSLTLRAARRQAVPELADGRLHLAVGSAARAPAYFRRMVHHELFHFADAGGPAGVAAIYDDPAFAALNAPGVTYGPAGAGGGGGGRWQGQVVSSALEAADGDDGGSGTSGPGRAPPPPFGMITSYCQAGVEEDKAEVFAHLMTQWTRTQRRCAADAALARKCAAIIARIEQLAGSGSDPPNSPRVFPRAQPPAPPAVLVLGAAAAWC